MKAVFYPDGERGIRFSSLTSCSLENPPRPLSAPSMAPVFAGDTPDPAALRVSRCTRWSAGTRFDSPSLTIESISYQSSSAVAITSTERGGFGFFAHFVFASETRLVPFRRHPWHLFLPLVGGDFGSNPPLSPMRVSVTFQALLLPLTLTERGGFEPPEPLRVQRFSRPSDSTTLASLQRFCQY